MVSCDIPAVAQLSVSAASTYRAEVNQTNKQGVCFSNARARYVKKVNGSISYHRLCASRNNIYYIIYEYNESQDSITHVYTRGAGDYHAILTSSTTKDVQQSSRSQSTVFLNIIIILDKYSSVNVLIFLKILNPLIPVKIVCS